MTSRDFGGKLDHVLPLVTQPHKSSTPISMTSYILMLIISYRTIEEKHFMQLHNFQRVTNLLIDKMAFAATQFVECRPPMVANRGMIPPGGHSKLQKRYGVHGRHGTGSHFVTATQWPGNSTTRRPGPILRIFLIIHTPMVSAGVRAYNRGLGAEPPAGVQGAVRPPWSRRGFCVWNINFQRICYSFAPNDVGYCLSC